MIGVSRKISLTYKFFRFFGLFPYTWCDVYDVGVGPKSRPGCISLKKSIIWKGWSFILTILIVSVAILDLYNAIKSPRGQVNNSQTLLVAHLIYDIITALGVVILQVSCWWHSEHLAEVVCLASEICREIRLEVVPFWKNYTTIMLCLFSSTSLGITLYCYIFGWYSHFYITSLISLCLRHLIFDSLMTCIAVIYHHNIEVAAHMLRTTVRPLIEQTKEDTIGDEDNRGGSTVNPWSKYREDDCTKVQEEASDAHAVKIIPLTIDNQTISHKSVLTIKEIHDQNLEKCAKKGLVIDFEKMESDIIKIFKYQRGFNEFISVPVAATMAVLITAVLVSCFYSSLWAYIDEIGHMLTFSHIMISVVPAIYISNIPSCYSKQASNTPKL